MGTGNGERAKVCARCSVRAAVCNGECVQWHGHLTFTHARAIMATQWVRLGSRTLVSSSSLWILVSASASVGS
jgi:hypothetical protein